MSPYAFDEDNTTSSTIAPKLKTVTETAVVVR